MTTIEPGKKVTRLTWATVFSKGRRREVVVTIRALTVEFRLKGERTSHALTIDALYKSAAAASVRDAKSRRAEERRALKAKE